MFELNTKPSNFSINLPLNPLELIPLPSQKEVEDEDKSLLNASGQRRFSDSTDDASVTQHVSSEKISSTMASKRPALFLTRHEKDYLLVWELGESIRCKSVLHHFTQGIVSLVKVGISHFATILEHKTGTERIDVLNYEDFIFIWSIRTLELECRLPWKEGHISTIAMSDTQEHFLASGDENGHVAIWNFRKNKKLPLEVIKIDTMKITILLFHIDSIFCGSQNGTLSLIECLSKDNNTWEKTKSFGENIGSLVQNMIWMPCRSNNAVKTIQFTDSSSKKLKSSFFSGKCNDKSQVSPRPLIPCMTGDIINKSHRLFKANSKNSSSRATPIIHPTMNILGYIITGSVNGNVSYFSVAPSTVLSSQSHTILEFQGGKSFHRGSVSYLTATKPFIVSCCVLDGAVVQNIFTNHSTRLAEDVGVTTASIYLRNQWLILGTPTGEIQFYHLYNTNPEVDWSPLEVVLLGTIHPHISPVTGICFHLTSSELGSNFLSDSWRNTVDSIRLDAEDHNAIDSSANSGKRITEKIKGDEDSCCLRSTDNMKIQSIISIAKDGILHALECTSSDYQQELAPSWITVQAVSSTKCTNKLGNLLWADKLQTCLVVFNTVSTQLQLWDPFLRGHFSSGLIGSPCVLPLLWSETSETNLPLIGTCSASLNRIVIAKLKNENNIYYTSPHLNSEVTETDSGLNGSSSIIILKIHSHNDLQKIGSLADLRANDSKGKRGNSYTQQGLLSPSLSNQRKSSFPNTISRGVHSSLSLNNLSIFDYLDTFDHKAQSLFHSKLEEPPSPLQNGSNANSVQPKGLSVVHCIQLPSPYYVAVISSITQNYVGIGVGIANRSTYTIGKSPLELDSFSLKNKGEEYSLTSPKKSYENTKASSPRVEKQGGIALIHVIEGLIEYSSYSCFPQPPIGMVLLEERQDSNPHTPNSLKNNLSSPSSELEGTLSYATIGRSRSRWNISSSDKELGESMLPTNVDTSNSIMGSKQSNSIVASRIGLLGCIPPLNSSFPSPNAWTSPSKNPEYPAIRNSINVSGGATSSTVIVIWWIAPDGGVGEMIADEKTKSFIPRRNLIQPYGNMDKCLSHDQWHDWVPLSTTQESNFSSHLMQILWVSNHRTSTRSQTLPSVSHSHLPSCLKSAILAQLHQEEHFPEPSTILFSAEGSSLRCTGLFSGDETSSSNKSLPYTFMSSLVQSPPSSIFVTLPTDIVDFELLTAMGSKICMSVIDNSSHCWILNFEGEVVFTVEYEGNIRESHPTERQQRILKFVPRLSTSSVSKDMDNSGSSLTISHSSTFRGILEDGRLLEESTKLDKNPVLNDFVHNLHQRKTQKEYLNHHCSVLDYDESRRLLLIGYRDGYIQVVDLSKRRVIARISTAKDLSEVRLCSIINATNKLFSLTGYSSSPLIRQLSCSSSSSIEKLLRQSIQNRPRGIQPLRMGMGS